MKEILELIIGEPFEKEWPIDYNIFSDKDEDMLNFTAPFIVKDKNEEVVLELIQSNGLTVAQFEDADNARLVVSIYDTSFFYEGKYYYEYHTSTMNGKKSIDITGVIEATTTKEESEPAKREVRPWDLFKSKDSPEGARVSEEVQKERYDICTQCPEFVKLTGQCKQCGCFMKAKTRLAGASCPLNKWLAEV
jgi:hypothetical protein